MTNHNHPFPRFLEIYPSFVTATRISQIDGESPHRVLVKFDTIRGYSTDVHFNPTPIKNDPVYMDCETFRYVNIEDYKDVESFKPSRVSDQIFAYQNTNKELSDKVNALDLMVKQLKGGETEKSLSMELEKTRHELVKAQDRNNRLYEDNKLLNQSLKDSAKACDRLQDIVKKLRNDLLRTADERDNKVEELAKAALPNLQNENTFLKERVRQLVEDNNYKVEDLVDANEAHILLLRENRKLKRALHKAKGREKYANKRRLGHFKEILELSQKNGELTRNLETVNKAYAQYRDEVKKKEQENQVDETPSEVIDDGKTVIKNFNYYFAPIYY